jgi:cell division FtsZ-interacting protein ZapD
MNIEDIHTIEEKGRSFVSIEDLIKLIQQDMDVMYTEGREFKSSSDIIDLLNSIKIQSQF